MTQYPEHEKMKAVQVESQAIGAFIEYSQGKGVEFRPSLGTADINQILAEYFEIDLNKIEKEKRQMLDEMRQANKKR